MLQHRFAIVASLLVAVAGFFLLGPSGTAHADPLAAPGVIAIDAFPLTNTATSIGPIDDCVSIPVGGSATVDVVVDSIPVYTGFDGGIAGFGFNILYPSSGPGALNVTASSTPLSIGDSLLTAYLTSLPFFSFSDPVPDSDGDFRIMEADLDGSNHEWGAGRLYTITVTSVGGPGVAVLDLNDTDGGDGDAVPDLYDSTTVAYTPNSVGDAYVSVGAPCPPPTPTPQPPTPQPSTPTPQPSTPTPQPPTPPPFPFPTAVSVENEVAVVVTRTGSSQSAGAAAFLASVILAAGLWVAMRRVVR
jgi:hypothetical protein